MSKFQEASFESSSQLQDEIASAIREHKRFHPLAPVTLIVDQPLQGFLFRRQLAETFAGTELRAIGNVNVLTLSELVEGMAQTLGIRTDPQPSGQVVEAAVYALMAKSNGEDSKSNQSLATASAIAKVFRTLDFVEDSRLEQLHSENFLNETQVDVFGYLLKARKLFGDRLSSKKLSKILDSKHPETLPKQFGQMHSLVSALPKNIRRLYEIMGNADIEITHWTPKLVTNTLPTPSDNTIIFSCPDPMTEVSITVRSVVQDLGKFRADRIAILAPSLSEYGSQIQAALNKTEISWHGKGKFIGQQSTLFRTLQIITDSLSQRRPDQKDSNGKIIPGHSGFDRRKLMRLLQNGNLNVRGLNIETKYVRKWVRKNSLYDDAVKWIQIIDTLSAEAQHENDQISAEHLKHLINYIESDLQALSSSKSWSDLGTGLLNLTESLHGGEIDLGDNSIEKKGWSSIRKLLLHELPLLDAIDFSSIQVEGQKPQVMGLPVEGNLVNLSRWVESQLGSRRVTSGDWSTGIFVGTVESAKFLKFDSVYVLGATEGLLPSVSGEDPFLPRRILEYLDESDLASNASENVSQNTLDFLSTVLTGTEKSTLTRPRGGTSGKLDDVESRFLPDQLRKTKLGNNKNFVEVPSYISSFDLPTLQLPPVTKEERSYLDPKVQSTSWARFSKSMWAWRNPQFNEYFGNLSNLTPETKIWFPTDLRPLSSSRVDTYLRCHYEFFALTVLGFNSNDNRDELKSFSPSAFGTFFHKEMELFIKYCKKEGLLPGPGENWDEGIVNGFLNRITNLNVLGSFTATGRGGWGTSFDLHLRKVISGVVQFFASEPEVLRGNPPLKIESAEEPFGKAGNKLQMVVNDDDGYPHWLVGQIDRLDVSGDEKALGVMDFKTGGRDKQLKKLGIGKSKKQSDNVFTLQDVIYRKAVLSSYKDATVKVHFVFIAEEGEDMYVNAIFADDPNGLLPRKLSEIRKSGETGLFVPQTTGSTNDHSYCRVCSSLGDASDVVKAKYKKSVAITKKGESVQEIDGDGSDE